MAATSVSNPFKCAPTGRDRKTFPFCNVRHLGRGTVKVIREVEAVSAYFGHPRFHSAIYQREQRIRHDNHLRAMRR